MLSAADQQSEHAIELPIIGQKSPCSYSSEFGKFEICVLAVLQIAASLHTAIKERAALRVGLTRLRSSSVILSQTLMWQPSLRLRYRSMVVDQMSVLHQVSQIQMVYASNCVPPSKTLDTKMGE